MAFIQLIWQILKYPQGWCIARRSLAIYLDAFNLPLFLLEFRRITDSSYQLAIPMGIYKKGNREGKSLRHFAMVAKFLDDNKLKILLKSKFELFQTSLI